jgi:hypothetical protein
MRTKALFNERRRSDNRRDGLLGGRCRPRPLIQINTDPWRVDKVSKKKKAGHRYPASLQHYDVPSIALWS